MVINKKAHNKSELILKLRQKRAFFISFDTETVIKDEVLSSECLKWEELSQRIHLFNHPYIAQKEISATITINTLFSRATFSNYCYLYVPFKRNNFSLSFELNNFTFIQQTRIFTEKILDEDIIHLKPKYKVIFKKDKNFFAKKWNKIKQ